MHRLIDFKGFADARLDLAKPFTLLIGKNGSGKSNAIEGVELLAKLAHGVALHEITDIGKAGQFEVRGGIARCARGDAPKFVLEFSGFSALFDGKPSNITYDVHVRVEPDVAIEFESLRVGGDRPLFITQPGAHGVLSVAYNDFTGEPNLPTKTISAERTVLARYHDIVSHVKSPKLVQAEIIVGALTGHLASAFVFDLAPTRLRQSDRIGASVLGRQGQNLSSALYALSQGDEAQRSALGRIRDAIIRLPEEPFEDFGFVVVEDLGEVTFGFKPSGGGRLVNARMVSDGTLRALGILTALETIPPKSRIIIEEIDNGLHPSRVGVLLDAIWKASHERELNVLATTHSPATMNHLSHEQLEGVVLAYHDVEKNAADLIPLFEVPAIDALLEQGGLGDLVTREVIEKHLKPRFEAAARDQAKAWLRSLP